MYRREHFKLTNMKFSLTITSKLLKIPEIVFQLLEPVHFLLWSKFFFFLEIKFNNMGLTEFFFELQLSDSSSTQFLFPYLPLQHHSPISPDSTSDLKYLNLVLLNKMLNVFRNYLVSYRQVEFSIKIPTCHSLSLSELSPNSSYTISDFW